MWPPIKPLASLHIGLPASSSAIPCRRQAVVRAVVQAVTPTNQQPRPPSSEQTPPPRHHALDLGFMPSIMPSPPTTQFAAFTFGRDPAAITCMSMRGKLPCPRSNQPRHLSSHTARATCKQGRRHHKSPINCPVTASRIHRRFKPITSNPSHHGGLANNSCHLHLAI